MSLCKIICQQWCRQKYWMNTAKNSHMLWSWTWFSCNFKSILWTVYDKPDVDNLNCIFSDFLNLCICIWSHTHVSCIAIIYVPVNNNMRRQRLGIFRNPIVKVKNVDFRNANFNFEKFDFQKYDFEKYKIQFEKQKRFE